MKINRISLYFLLVFLFFLFNFYYRPVSSNPLMTKQYKKSTNYVNNLYVSDEYFKEKLISKNEYYIYEKFLSDVKKGKGTSKVECKKEGCSSSFMQTYKAIYLDHPELIAFKSCTWSDYKSYLNVRYDNLNQIQAYLGARRIEREIDIVRKETKEMSDKEKILFVYDYVSKRSYDHLFMFSNSNQSAYSFFTKGTSVCAGFAKASQILFQNIGIKSYLVMNEEHMWNYVEYEGKYYVFDSTMGACYIKGSEHYYDGLGKTTVGVIEGDYSSFYPPIEVTPLREVFNV